MPIVTVTDQYQVEIPQQLRDEIGIAIGDVFEARAEQGRIIFEPKPTMDPGIAESVAEFQSGKGFGPFPTHKEFLGALHKEARKGTKSRRKS